MFFGADEKGYDDMVVGESISYPKIGGWDDILAPENGMGLYIVVDD